MRIRTSRNAAHRRQDEVEAGMAWVRAANDACMYALLVISWVVTRARKSRRIAARTSERHNSYLL
jgi:hypothetical protein